MDAVSPWRHAEEITFECEPGTLTEAKLAAIREIGVTRLSLGVENFDDRHARDQRPGPSLAGDRQGVRVRAVARRSRRSTSTSSPACSGETDDELADVRRSRRSTLRARQRHHLPDGAAVQHHDQPRRSGPATRRVDGEVASWSTKRRWVDEAFDGLRGRRLHGGLGYAVVKDPATKFVYRDRLWQGADMVGLGRRVVRPHQRRAHAEPRFVRAVLRRDRAGRLPLARGAAADRRGAPDPRVRAAAEARRRSRRPTSSGSTASTCSSGSATPLDALADERLLTSRATA